MDVLSVRVETDNESVWDDQVVFLVNGLDLRVITPRTGADSEWVGPPSDVLRRFPDHLRGGPDRWEDPADPWYRDAAVLACGCGFPGCDAVLARIVIHDDRVTWHLLNREGEPIGVGPFCFDRTAYEASLHSI